MIINYPSLSLNAGPLIRPVTVSYDTFTLLWTASTVPYSDDVIKKLSQGTVAASDFVASNQIIQAALIADGATSAITNASYSGTFTGADLTLSMTSRISADDAVQNLMLKVQGFAGVVNTNPVATWQLSNYLRNSGFWFAQRQAPGTLTTYSSTAGRAFSADGWAITNENASCRYIRTDTSASPETNLQSRFYGAFTKITATGKFAVSQCVEGVDVQNLRGRTVRFQVRIKATAALTVRIGLIQVSAAGTTDTIPATFISAFGANQTDPTLGTNLAYIAPKADVLGDNCTTSGNAATCLVSSNWQRYGAVFDVPTNCKNLIVMVWTDSQFTATNGFSLAQASLTDGFEIQNWSPPHYTSELFRTLRFYQKSFLIDTLPANSVGLNTGEVKGVAGKAGATAGAGVIQVRYLVPMRAAPTTNTVFNPAAANALARNVTATADLGATTITGPTAQGFHTISTGISATAVGDLISIHYISDAEL